MSGSRSAALPVVDRDAGPVLEALLDLGGTALVPVRGDSMRPTLIDGDRILVAPFLGLPEPGQIVLARVAGLLVAHRLISIRMQAGRRQYRLQGEHEPGYDAAVLREEILGRVVAAVRQGRRIEIDDSGAARRRALRRCAWRRRGLTLRRALGALVVSILAAYGLARAADQEGTLAPPLDYAFAPGDILSLRVWDGQQVDELRLTVQSDGEAFMPIKGIGSLKIAGKTPPQVKQDIEKRLAGIFKETTIELLVLKYGGHRVNLMGEVRTTSRTDSGPGEWSLQGPTRLVSFLSTHGGPGENADLMRIHLARHSGEKQDLNLFRAVFQDSEQDNPLLEAGDLVYIPTLAMGNRKVYVLGEVNNPGVVTIFDHLGLVEAIARAGGFNPRGYMKGVVVVKRNPEGQPEMKIADFKEMFKTGKLAADIALDPGDIVFVPRRGIVTLQEVFSIINPALGAIEAVYIIDNFRKN